MGSLYMASTGTLCIRAADLLALAEHQKQGATCNGGTAVASDFALRLHAQPRNRTAAIVYIWLSSVYQKWSEDLVIPSSAAENAKKRRKHVHMDMQTTATARRLSRVARLTSKCPCL